MLSEREKRFLADYIHQTEGKGAFIPYTWVAWVVFTLGGILTVYTLGITRANLDATTIRYVFVPGIGFGLLLMMAGIVVVKMAARVRTDRKRAAIVKKLL